MKMYYIAISNEKDDGEPASTDAKSKRRVSNTMVGVPDSEPVTLGNPKLTKAL